MVAVKFEEGDDVEYFAKKVGKVLFVDEKGDMYCWDWIGRNRSSAYFHPEKEEWGPSTRIDFDTCKALSDEESDEVFKKYPPFDCYEKMTKDKGLQVIAELAERRKKTPRKVIGWVKYGNDNWANEENDDYLAALVNDIKEHGYCFCGEFFELFPVFDDETMLSFGSRGWGHVMALSQDKGDEYAYTEYAFGGFFDDSSVEPEIGFYPGHQVKVYVDDATYKEIIRLKVDFPGEKEADEFPSAIYCLDEYRTDGHPVISARDILLVSDSGETYPFENAEEIETDKLSVIEEALSEREMGIGPLFHGGDLSRIEAKLNQGFAKVIIF